MKAKAVVAEDSQTSLAMVKDLLENQGYQVIVAKDGIEAIESVYRESPDVVILDVVMPRMNGYQVCRMLKLDEETANVPVIMLTSKDQPSDQYWGLQTGADGYVTKEQPLQLLLDTVKSVLEKRNALCTYKPTKPLGRPTSAIDLLTRLNDILDRKLYEATILGEVSKLAWSATDMDLTTQKMMDLFRKLFDFDYACLVMRGAKARLFDVFVMTRVSTSEDVIKKYEDITLSILAEKSGLEIPAESSIQRRLVLAPGVCIGSEYGSRSMSRLCHTTVIGSRDAGIGVFTFWMGEQAKVSQESLQIVSTLANAAYVVLDNARLYQQMQKLATTDELTGLANYRLFQETLEREYQRSRRTGEPLAVIILDLDDFKAINDTFGHKYGDQVLQSVATAFMGSARQYDLVARYGGEEFAVILPGSNAKGAAEMGERLRLLVRTVAARMQLERLSTSVGVAVYPNPRITDSHGLVREADAALYRAKREGKNRVRMAPMR